MGPTEPSWGAAGGEQGTRQPPGLEAGSVVTPSTQRSPRPCRPQARFPAAVGLGTCTTTCQISGPRWQPTRRASSWWGSSSGSTAWMWCRPTWATFRWVWGTSRGAALCPPKAAGGGGCLPHPGGGTAASQHSPRQANAELAVRDMLRAFGSSRQARGLPLEVSAEDHMDDGSPIRLRVHINLSQVRLPQQGPGGGASVAWPPYR